MVANRWFDEKYYLLWLVCQFMAMGPIYGQKLTADLVNNTGWQLAIDYMAIFALVLTVLFSLLIRDPKNIVFNKSSKFSEFLELLKNVVNKKHNWVLALYTFTCWAPMILFPGR